MTKKTKLLWVIDSLGYGGAESLMLPLLRHFNRETFDLRVCALQAKNNNPVAAEISELGIPVDQLNIRYLRDISNIPELRMYYAKHQPDLVHTQLQFADTLGTAAANILRIPCISTQHTIGAFEENSKGMRRQRLMWFFLRNFSDRIIAVSEQTRQYHIEVGKIDPAKIITLYNGIEIQRFSEVPNETRQSTKNSLGLTSDDQVIITVAVLREPKGLNYMLEAIPDLLVSFPNLKYLIVGDGPHRTALEMEIQQLGISEHVILTGQRTDIPQLLSAADLFVLPTLTDALPTVLFEALAAKVPIVATNVGGIPEIISDQHDGYLVPPRDVRALVRVTSKMLSNRTAADIFRLNGFEKVLEKFSIQGQIDNLSELYHKVIHEKRR